MYKEEKIINGILHYRTSPNAEFKPYTLENLTGIVGMLKEEMQKQEQGNIEGKDPITIDCTNPKGGAIPKLGTKEFNNLAMEMFGGKPKKELEKEMFELEQELDIPSHLRWHNSEPKQRLEKYSERFDNKDNEVVEGVFNPENWGKRLVKEEPDYTALLKQVGTIQRQNNNLYSEEEVLNILNEFCDNFYENSIRKDVIEKWFERFKKK